MNDNDDGHTITSSDLFCISPDGRTVRQLTFTKNTIELNPKCSPAENKIVCNSLDGEILLMTYVETGK
jgi:Tol biopolymer transport system component